ncbi:MAG: Pesticidal crystal protein Cry22Aa [Bacteroidetes bacterium MED-G17]|nr:MAG: Pesticidal crystal protein Cry22Aa [Bacteroidetes bacterium MED-G17]
MRKTFTKTFFHQALIVFGLLIPLSSIGQTYSTTTHYYGCRYQNRAYYSAIARVEIVDASGGSIYSKVDGCNNNQTGFANAGQSQTFINPNNAINLAGGSSYTIRVNATNTGNGGYGSSRGGVWIDFNGDGDFIDGGEFITPNNWTLPEGRNEQEPGSYASRTFTVPCGYSGSARIRVRSTYRYWNINSNYHTNAMYYGETEDFLVNFTTPSSVSANFSLPDTAFVKARVNFLNTNQTGYISHAWDTANDGVVDGTSTNFSTVFTSGGKKSIRLKSTNCAGSDSIVKTIFIKAPTVVPNADFIISKNKEELFRQVQLTDLSDNGAYYWEWRFIDEAKKDTFDFNTWGQLAQIGYPNLAGGNDQINKNPIINTGNYFTALPVGVYTVCLTSANDIGSSNPKCKPAYFEVTESCDFAIGAQTNNQIIECLSGTITDNGGINGNYSNGLPNTTEALIVPCGAESITMVMDSVRLNDAGDLLTIYDGENNQGNLLASYSGPATISRDTLTANSGAIYMTFETNGTGNQWGFNAHWYSEIGPKTPPKADFLVEEACNTLYTAVDYVFKNTSQNVKGKVDYEWTIDGNLAGITNDLPQKFLTNATYNVCLEATTCQGSNKICKTYTVSAPNAQAADETLDFVADNRRPKQTDIVTLSASYCKGTNFSWGIFPTNGVKSITDVSAKNNNSEVEVEFSAPGKYTVSLTSFNYTDTANTEKTAVKDKYIVVVEYCTPLVSVGSNSDVGISKVSLTDNSNNVLLENVETNAATTYDNFEGKIDAPTLNFGVDYTVSIDRSSTNNPLNRKVWIDFNIDGDFDDAGEELIGYETTATTTSFSKGFTVPDLKDAFEGQTIMRIGTSYNTDPNKPCGANSNAKANRIGEFEDYAIVLANDNASPVLTLNNDDTLYIEQGASYIEYGAVAKDPIEGDISNRIDINSDVDSSLTGIYFVNYTVEDASGNTAQPLTRVVYVVKDQTPPTLTLNGASSIDLEICNDYTEPGYSANDAKEGNLTTAVVVSGEVNTSKLGAYTLNYYVQDAQGNADQATRTVNVVDTKAPMIENDEADKTNPSQWIVNVQLQSVFVDRTTSSDPGTECFIDRTWTQVAKPGIGPEAIVDTRLPGFAIIDYTVTDQSGNETTQQIKYVIEDFIAPVISLNSLDTILHPVFSDYNPIQASAIDNLYNQSEISVTLQSNVNPYQLGTYQDTYTAIDGSGNKSSKVRTVKVVDVQSPRIRGRFGSLIKVAMYSKFDAIERVIFEDNYDGPTDLKANAEILSHDLNTDVPGLYHTTFVTKDNSGNRSNEFTLFIQVCEEFTNCQYIGVDEVALKNMINVYPNPSNGIVNITTGLDNEDVDVQVIDINGANVLSTKVLGDKQIDLRHLASGVYMIKASFKGQSTSKRIMINN